MTYANVVATLSLFLVLSGGAAYAANHLGKNSVGTKQLQNNSVTGAKVKNGSLKGADFATGQLQSGLQGPPGAPGEPGAALGYAHVYEGKLVVAQTKGVVAIAPAVNFSEEGAYDTTICFKLSIKPANISVTPDAIASSQAHPAVIARGTVPAYSPSVSHTGCPKGFLDAEVEAISALEAAPNGFWVLFN